MKSLEQAAWHHESLHSLPRPDQNLLLSKLFDLDTWHKLSDGKWGMLAGSDVPPNVRIVDPRTDVVDRQIDLRYWCPRCSRQFTYNLYQNDPRGPLALLQEIGPRYLGCLFCGVDSIGYEWVSAILSRIRRRKTW